MPIPAPLEPAYKTLRSCRLVPDAPARITRMKQPVHGFAEGDRVRAPRRPQFPQGTVVKLMAEGFLLVRWDGDVLETAHHSELERADDASG
jgi:hypothetical protein